MSETRIDRGIEWFPVGDENARQEDNQCARCGSSCDFIDCWNCDHGIVEKDIGDGCCEELIDVQCEVCEGRGGRWHCMSTPDWCHTHPIRGREHIESTALKSEAWNE